MSLTKLKIKAHNTGLLQAVEMHKLEKLCWLTVKCSETHPNAKPKNVALLCKKTADQQMAHLVFADTQPNAEKPKEPFFANARTN